MSKPGYSLHNIVQHACKIKHIAKESVYKWDYILVKTSNSLYTIRKIDERLYEISGGWFDKKGLSPSKMIIRGCSWGGSVIHIKMLAACGLCLEFGNNVITSPVSKIIVIRGKNCN